MKGFFFSDGDGMRLSEEGKEALLVLSPSSLCPSSSVRITFGIDVALAQWPDDAMPSH